MSALPLAKLAADYLNVTTEEVASIAPYKLAAVLRKLAASVLRPVEKDSGK